MYTQVWNKYLPVIKILLKRSVANEQTLDMNVTDFERAGAKRKSGNKFHIHFVNARVENALGSSTAAKDLASTLLEDAVVKELLTQNEYDISMNTKFQLLIKRIAKLPVQEAASDNNSVAITE